MTDTEFLAALKKTGIPEGSKDYLDYEEAKSLAVFVSTKDGENYEDLIKVCADYVGV